MDCWPLGRGSTLAISRRAVQASGLKNRTARPRRRNPDGGTMSDLESALADLVAANRILGHEGILDAFGHVTIRHPEDPTHFFMSRARAPELIERSDILEFTLDGTPIDPDGPAAYIERFIHGAIYEARRDV